MSFRIIVFYFLVIVSQGMGLDDIENKLIGSWKYEESNACLEVTYSQGGVYFGALRIDNVEVWKFSGKWRIVNSGIETEYTDSSSPRVAIGKLDFDEIIEIDAIKLKIRASDGDIRTYRKNELAGK